MNKKNLISIIVPVYNSERFLDDCVKSVLSQSYPHFELILVNDGSTDNSGNICDRYSQTDSRVKVRYRKNKGPAAARNLGLRDSQGELIFFCDSDDTLPNTALESLVRAYAEHHADITIGDFQKVKNGVAQPRTDIQIPISKMFDEQGLIDYAQLYLKKPNKQLLFAFSWARLFKSAIIKDQGLEFDESLHTFEDVAFNFDYLRQAKSAFFLKEPVYNHTIYDSYSSATMSVGANPRKLLGFQQALNNIGKFLKGKIPEEEIIRQLGHANTTLSIIQLVRACGQLDESTQQGIYDTVQELVNDERLREGLKHYSPDKGESKLLPFLMKLKLVTPIVKLCQYKAKKRYKK